MEDAHFETNIRPAPSSADGCDEVSFLVSTNKGTAKGPIGKIASGGELSRFLLALKVCLTRDYSSVTMIFDEIDRGIGELPLMQLVEDLLDCPKMHKFYSHAFSPSSSSW